MRCAALPGVFTPSGRACVGAATHLLPDTRRRCLMLTHLLSSKRQLFRGSSGRRMRLRWRPQVEALEQRCVLATAYLASDLVSDQPGVAPVTDANLVNAWGIAVNPTGAFWVSSNGADISTLYTGDVAGSKVVMNSLEVTIPGGAPTGQVFNRTSDFVVTHGTTNGVAAFIFASTSGIVSGWNPGAPTGSLSTQAQVGYTAMDGAIYKGIALANNGTANFLYVADFHNAKIDVLDTNFHIAHLGGSFADPNLPEH